MVVFRLNFRSCVAQRKMLFHSGFSLKVFVSDSACLSVFTLQKELFSTRGPVKSIKLAACIYFS